MYIRVRQYTRKGQGRHPVPARCGVMYYFEAIESYRDKGIVKKRVRYRWKSTETTIEGAIAEQQRNIDSTLETARTLKRPPYQPNLDKAHSIIATLRAVQRACPDWKFNGTASEVRRA